VEGLPNPSSLDLGPQDLEENEIFFTSRHRGTERDLGHDLQPVQNLWYLFLSVFPLSPLSLGVQLDGRCTISESNKRKVKKPFSSFSCWRASLSGHRSLCLDDLRAKNVAYVNGLLIFIKYFIQDQLNTSYQSSTPTSFFPNVESWRVFGTTFWNNRAVASCNGLDEGVIVIYCTILNWSPYR
jgi:hypothetical protein